MGKETQTSTIEVPRDFSLQRVIESHGWSALAPFSAVNEPPALTFTFLAEWADRPVTVTVSEAPSKSSISFVCESAENGTTGQLRRTVGRVLRLDTDLEGLRSAVWESGDLRWIADTGSGRLLRSPSVFEDIVKTMCTTNCSWSLTKLMVSRLVEEFGEESPSGNKAFPTPEAMASKGPDFYRTTIRAGYRSEYLHEFAENVAAGKIDPESWLDSPLSTDELTKELLSVKGVGKYAAESVLKLLGRYDTLALDSFLRSEFYKRHNDGEKCPDSVIEKHYEPFGEWKGLVMWFDMCGE
ncbi:MAG: hypothetical protein J5I65_08610 [Aridibacter famidurans]|nr:hypothetical protein [Aridibacter famidurans]